MAYYRQRLYLGKVYSVEGEYAEHFGEAAPFVREGEGKACLVCLFLV